MAVDRAVLQGVHEEGPLQHDRPLSGNLRPTVYTADLTPVRRQRRIRGASTDTGDGGTKTLRDLYAPRTPIASMFAALLLALIALGAPVVSRADILEDIGNRLTRGTAEAFVRSYPVIAASAGVSYRFD